MALTKEQNDVLARNLHGTKKNVYDVARALFDYEFEEEDFDRLKADGKIFRCEECSEWLVVGFEDRSISGMCSECVDGIDRE